MSDARQERGRVIANDRRVRKVTESKWSVPSQSAEATAYIVDIEAGTCACPDFETRGVKCKHRWAVEYVRHQVVEADGSTTVVESLSVKRTTYKQNWPAYNAAQTAEK